MVQEESPRNQKKTNPKRLVVLLLILAFVFYLFLVTYMPDFREGTGAESFMGKINSEVYSVVDGFFYNTGLAYFEFTGTLDESGFFDVGNDIGEDIAKEFGDIGTYLGKNAGLFIFAILVFLICLWGSKSSKLSGYGPYFQLGMMGSTIIFIGTLLKPHLFEESGSLFGINLNLLALAVIIAIISFVGLKYTDKAVYFSFGFIISIIILSGAFGEAFGEGEIGKYLNALGGLIVSGGIIIYSLNLFGGSIFSAATNFVGALTGKPPSKLNELRRKKASLENEYSKTYEEGQKNKLSSKIQEIDEKIHELSDKHESEKKQTLMKSGAILFKEGLKALFGVVIILVASGFFVQSANVFSDVPGLGWLGILANIISQVKFWTAIGIVLIVGVGFLFITRNSNFVTDIGGYMSKFAKKFKRMVGGKGNKPNPPTNPGGSGGTPPGTSSKPPTNPRGPPVGTPFNSDSLDN